LKVVGLAFFGLSMLLTSIGIWIHVMWMKHASAKQNLERQREATVSMPQDFSKEGLANGEPGNEEVISHISNQSKTASFSDTMLPRDIKVHPRPASISQGEKENILKDLAGKRQSLRH